MFLKDGNMPFASKSDSSLITIMELDGELGLLSLSTSESSLISIMELEEEVLEVQSKLLDSLQLLVV